MTPIVAADKIGSRLYTDCQSWIIDQAAKTNSGWNIRTNNQNQPNSDRILANCHSPFFAKHLTQGQGMHTLCHKEFTCQFVIYSFLLLLLVNIRVFRWLINRDDIICNCYAQLYRHSSYRQWTVHCNPLDVHMRCVCFGAFLPVV